MKYFSYPLILLSIVVITRQNRKNVFNLLILVGLTSIFLPTKKVTANDPNIIISLEIIIMIMNTGNSLRFPMSIKIEITNALSAIASKYEPSSLWTLKYLAINPSKKSLTAIKKVNKAA